MLEMILEVVGEFVLQVGVEWLLELGLHAMAAPFRKPVNRWLAALGYAIFGLIAGGLSLLVLPASLAHGDTLRIVNLVVTPLAAGLFMALVGAWRARRGQQLLRIDRFAYGYLFALVLALVRFRFAY